jgi:hypothetical protein
MKICFKILKFSVRPSDFFSSNQLYLMSIFGTLIDVLAVTPGSGGVAIGAGALKTTVDVGTGAVATDPGAADALVVVHALLAIAVQLKAKWTLAPISSIRIDTSTALEDSWKKIRRLKNVNKSARATADNINNKTEKASSHKPRIFPSFCLLLFYFLFTF